MDVNTIVQWVISILPSVIAVLTTVGVIIKTLKEFKQLKQQVTDMKAIEDVRAQLKMILQENYQLKDQLNKTIAKINHVKTTDSKEK